MGENNADLEALIKDGQGRDVETLEKLFATKAEFLPSRFEKAQLAGYAFPADRLWIDAVRGLNGGRRLSLKHFGPKAPVNA